MKWNPIEEAVVVGAAAALVAPVLAAREALTLVALCADHVTGERWDLRARLPWWARNRPRGKEREREWRRFVEAMQERHTHE